MRKVWFNMNNNKKNAVMLTLVYLVIFIAYNLLVFLVFNKFTTVFWISYGFMLTAYLVHIGCAVVATQNTSIRLLFFGIPLLSLSIFFTGAEFFCSFVFMLFQSVVAVKLAILLQGLLLCLFIVVGVIAVATKDAVEQIDGNIKQNVNFMKGLLIDVELLMEQGSSTDIMMELKKLWETIKYSDPMTDKAVSVQEQMIMQEMIQLKRAFDENDTVMVKDFCGRINLLFIERNKKLMILK